MCKYCKMVRVLFGGVRVLSWLFAVRWEIVAVTTTWALCKKNKIINEKQRIYRCPGVNTTPLQYI